MALNLLELGNILSPAAKALIKYKDPKHIITQNRVTFGIIQILYMIYRMWIIQHACHDRWSWGQDSSVVRYEMENLGAVWMGSAH